MTIKNTMTAFVAVAALSLPVVSLASTYLYVDTSGNLKSVEAANATEAIATAPSIAANSGVILEASYEANDSSTPVNSTPVITYTETTSAGNLYSYVKTDGELAYITANSATEALAKAPGIAYNSGVQLIIK